MSRGTQQPTRSPARTYGLTVGLVAVATVLSATLRSVVSPPDIVMLYLLVIMIAAGRYGRGAAISAAALSVASYDFFFVPPLYAFAVSELKNLLTFATMFVIGVVMSGLRLQIRQKEEDARNAALRAEAEEMRSALLSAVSHDFRTPLATITGAATTLRDFPTTISDEQRSDLVEVICEEADRLERLVANLLDMTRIEAGALEVRREWVPLQELIGSTLTRLEGRLGSRSVRTVIGDDVPLAFVDPVLIEQLFMNLLENATKYTPAGSPLEIEVSHGPEALVIEFRDRGPGFYGNEEEKIFGRFYRGTTAGVPGAGLGLPICRGIAAAHGGTIEAANRSGGGAVFRVTLPLGETPPELPREPEIRRSSESAR